MKCCWRSVLPAISDEMPEQTEWDGGRLRA